MAQNLPKGRMTIHSKQRNGLPMRRARLWEFNSAPGTVREKLERAYLDALDAVDVMDATREQLATGKRLTEQGAREQFQRFVFEELVPRFHKDRQTIKQAQQQLADRRAILQLPKADPTDAVGAIQRMEIRSWLRGLSQAERDKITQASDLDPKIKQAIIESPREMSGVAPSHHNMILESVMRQTHGPLLDEIAELERGIEVAISAVETGRDEARLESGISDPREFDRRAAPFEQNVGVAWLRKKGERVVVVDLDKRVERPATPDEIATGVFFSDYTEYSQYNAT